MNKSVEVLIFDWGDTVMYDYGLPGAMADWPEVALKEGAKEALMILSGKYRCAIATSADFSDVSAMRRALRRVDVERYFDDFFASADLGYQKPDPRFFEAVAKALETEPLACVMIGNSYEKDIVGAKKAGMAAILLDEKHVYGNAPEAEFVIDNMYELIKILDNNEE
ncbi:MAG TPA: HAD family hydrolase [Bacteroidales bacterium]|nr:HAD family hydrolase [Bacteroidales bacterium]